MTAAIMIQGTGSNVGKSLLVAGLCRHFARSGLMVLPFKPQNMSNNAAVTADGGEIGRAQALQARACFAEAVTDMNPVLLKPETETGAQVIVQGRLLRSARARDYASMKAGLMAPVLDSFGRLRKRADLVIVEGAGSPAEINLRPNDLANMGFAEAANLPVVLAGDIDRGGVIAQIVGTRAILSPGDAGRIKGFIVNKFRGDPALFDSGAAAIVAHTGWNNLGIVPWFSDAALLPAEDALEISGGGDGPLKIAVPMLSRIANFDDLDPLKLEPGVTLQIVQPGQPLPADATLVILPGSKSTLGDMRFLRSQGWDIDILAHVRRGGHVLGLCGGYQMLGRSISDPLAIEGPAGSEPGLGLLDVSTEMLSEKSVRAVAGRDLISGSPVRGYEIHIGTTQGPDCRRAWLDLDGRLDGAASANGRVSGCYVHGLFAEDGFRRDFLRRLGGTSSMLDYEAEIDRVLDGLADHLAQHVDCDRILAIARHSAAAD